MISRILRAYQFEMYKALHFRYTLLGPALVLLVVLCAPLLYPIGRDGVSDYGFIAYTTPVALNFLGFMLLLIYSAGLISTEIGSGTIRQVLIRPLRRHEFVFAKLMTGMSYALLLTLLVSGATWLLAVLLGELTGVHYGGELIFTQQEMSKAYFLGGLLSLPPQWAGVAFALLLSSLTRSPLAAATGTVGLWIVLDLVKYPLGIEQFVFSTYLEKPWSIYISRCDGIDSYWFPMTWYCLGVPGITFLVFTLLTLLVMRRRNFSGC